MHIKNKFEQELNNYNKVVQIIKLIYILTNTLRFSSSYLQCLEHFFFFFYQSIFYFYKVKSLIYL